jgi:hypothetical protein
MASAASPGASSAGAALVARLLASDAGSGEDLSALTVEQWLKQHLARLVKSAEDTVDDAVDALLLAHKQAREELRNWQHQRSAEQALKFKAARKVTWNIRLTIEAAGEEASGGAGGGGGSRGSSSSSSAEGSVVGRSFVLTPRQRNGGMCRIGRSTGADFQEPRGVSLPFDCSISVWHGKFTAVYGQVFYSDLNTRNGSLHNGCVPLSLPRAHAPRRSPFHASLPAPHPPTPPAHPPPPLPPPPMLRSASVPKDQPILLADGDELCLGDVRLRVGLERAAAEEELQENGGGR